MPAPTLAPPPATNKPANAAPPQTAVPVKAPDPGGERAPLVARVKPHNRYAGKGEGNTVTFTVRKVSADWHAFADKIDLGAAPHPDAAWRLVDREMRNAAHALTTDAAEAAKVEAKAAAPRTTAPARRAAAAA